MNGAALLVRALEQEGARLVFGYPGGAIMPFYDALVGSSIRHVLVRHEQGAALAANGFARASGRPGVCVATSGPGATNLITGVADAFLDSVPLVAITGQVACPLLGTDAFQEVDAFGLFLPIVKHSFLVRDVGDLPGVVRQAFRIATEGRPGPVHIDLPKDVALADARGLSPLAAEPPSRPPAPSPDALERARALLAASMRPVVYAGGGVVSARAVPAFRRFVATCGLPTVLTLRGLGVLPGRDPHLLGMIGMHGSRAANLAVQECDLLIAVGVRFDDRATGKLSEFAPAARVVHLDIDPAEVGKLRAADAALLGDLGAALSGLATQGNWAQWRVRCLARRQDDRCPVDERQVDAPTLLRQLSEHLPQGSIITCDVGQHQMWVAQHCVFDRPEAHLSSGGLGTMGFGLPAAIGAQFAQPDATVVNVAGDGSFLMNVQELATVARYELPIKIVVVDNQALGMVRQWQELFFAERYSEIDLSDNPDFGEVAAAFRMPSLRLDHPADLDSILDRFLSAPGACLLHAPIARAANVWPLVPPNASNAQMLDDPSEARDVA